jgi:hypothetical protein
MIGQIYHCTDERCSSESVDNGWTTQNGYKYHLQHRCYRNPSSEIYEKLARGETVRGPKTGTPSTILRCEVCMQFFSSSNGYLKHQFANGSTRDGRCANGPRKGLSAGEDTLQSQTGGKFAPTGGKY